MNQSPELANESCSSIEKENDTILWIGTGNGLFTLNLNTYQPTKVCLPKNKEECISNLQIKNLYKHSSGALFIGAEKEVVWMHYKNHLYPIYNPYSPDSTFDDILSFTEDRNHNIWFTSSRKQVYCYDIKKHKVIYYRLFDKDIYGVSHHKEFGILVAGIDGIFKFDSSISKLVTLKNALFKNANQLIPVHAEMAYLGG
jgi:ligand-binding sensor domain-containing protein